MYCARSGAERELQATARRRTAAPSLDARFGCTHGLGRRGEFVIGCRERRSHNVPAGDRLPKISAKHSTQNSNNTLLAHRLGAQAEGQEFVQLATLLLRRTMSSLWLRANCAARKHS